jgi:hypothetical protein
MAKEKRPEETGDKLQTMATVKESLTVQRAVRLQATCKDRLQGRTERERKAAGFDRNQQR